MSNSNMFDDDDPRGKSNNSPRLTIVGGRPPERKTKLPPIPVGLQNLLRLASVDGEFCEALVNRRDEMAAVADIKLTTSERAMLRSISAEQIRAMAGRLPEPAVNRRSFLRESARAAVLLLGGTALAGCAEKTKKNKSLKEDPPKRAKRREFEGEGGAAPKLPEKKPDQDKPNKKESDKEKQKKERDGLEEDPPERSKRREFETTGGAAPDFPEEKPDGDKTSKEKPDDKTPDEKSTKKKKYSRKKDRPKRVQRRESASGGGATPHFPEE